MGTIQTTGQVHHKRQTVERPGLDPADRKIKVKTFSPKFSNAQMYQLYFPFHDDFIYMWSYPEQTVRTWTSGEVLSWLRVNRTPRQVDRC